MSVNTRYTNSNRGTSSLSLFDDLTPLKEEVPRRPIAYYFLLQPVPKLEVIIYDYDWACEVCSLDLSQAGTGMVVYILSISLVIYTKSPEINLHLTTVLPFLNTKRKLYQDWAKENWPCVVSGIIITVFLFHPFNFGLTAQHLLIPMLFNTPKILILEAKAGEVNLR